MDTKKNHFELEKVYTFDIAKANQIFNHLLANNITKLLNGHIMLTKKEMK